MRHRAVHQSRRVLPRLKAKAFDHPSIHEVALGALMQLVAIEGEPEAFESLEAYRAHRATHRDIETSAMALLRRYGSLLVVDLHGTDGLAVLRARAKALGGSKSFSRNPVAQGVVQAALSQAWNGLAGWQA
ncbi:hypothetical protein [Asaia bogorensis]|uniref:hypothetical protein n=1 Tax=Asaia bogorensis TaxID=91915 RepID=UPI0011BD64FF|nr:hypothetical protein [Asaia bogorensis]GBQ81624.1 hypothetical protein AA0311_2659 [Asaia bogorensis NBRC 16594]